MNYESTRYEFYKDETLTGQFFEGEKLSSWTVDAKSVASEFHGYVSFNRSNGSKAKFELKTVLAVMYRPESKGK